MREPISKKLRFEVFKRDNFTCQYCGRKAPDVILEIDHIDPVKNGGKSNIMNLLTSCKDCNRGKGARPLTDNQVIKQQQEQLEEINERREQLKLMLKWKKELEKFDSEQVDIIQDIVESVSGKTLSEYGRNKILKTIKEFGIDEVIESTNISVDQYYDGDESVPKVLDYISKICAVRARSKEDPWLAKINYIKAIMRNRFGIYSEHRTNTALRAIVTDKENCEMVIDIAKEARNWTIFWQWINEQFGGGY